MFDIIYTSLFYIFFYLTYYLNVIQPVLVGQFNSFTQLYLIKITIAWGISNLIQQIIWKNNFF